MSRLVGDLRKLSAREKADFRDWARKLINRGILREDAARLIGVSYDQVWKWTRGMKAARKPQPPRNAEVEPEQLPTDTIGFLTLSERAEIYRGRVERGEQLWSDSDCKVANIKLS